MSYTHYAVGLLIVAVSAASPGAGGLRAATPMAVYPDPHAYDVFRVAFSPDGKTLATASRNHTVTLWNTADGKPRWTHYLDANNIAFSHNGSVLAVSGDRTVELWSLPALKLKRTLHHASGPIAFSPNDRILATTGPGNTAKLWSAETGALRANLAGLTNTVWRLAFSRDGSILASGSGSILPTASGDSTIQLWGVATGTLLRTLRAHTDIITQMIFTPDGRTLASTSINSTSNVTLWNVTTGRPERSLPAEPSDVQLWCMALSPDGHTLATGGGVSFGGGDAKFWDLSSGKLLNTLAGHESQVEDVAFSPNGKILATASNDSSARLWDAHTGALLHVLKGHVSSVIVLAFSPDGSLLATGSDDHTARLWNVATGELEQTLGVPVRPRFPLTDQ